jgi:hypothetical protein
VPVEDTVPAGCGVQLALGAVPCTVEVPLVIPGVPEQPVIVPVPLTVWVVGVFVTPGERLAVEVPPVQVNRVLAWAGRAVPTRTRPDTRQPARSSEMRRMMIPLGSCPLGQSGELSRSP